MVETDWETVIDVDGILIGYISSHVESDDDEQDDTAAGLTVYDADYNLIGPARNHSVAKQLLRQQRTNVSKIVPVSSPRRYSHSF